MRCPKCGEGTLQAKQHFQWRCECGFGCGIAFFFDDENLAVKLEVGMSVEQLTLSERAQELIDSKVLSLDELQMAVEIKKLPSIQKAEQGEDDITEYNTMMRDVIGRSAEIHRHLTNGDTYRKNRSGGLIGKQRG